MDDKERWRPAPEFDGYYEVSNMGRVRTVERSGIDGNGRAFRVRGKVIRDRVNHDGHKRVVLMVAGKRFNKTVHRLVAGAFCEKPVGSEIVRHLDGTRTNNRDTNLKWGTHRENQADRWLHGTHGAGRGNGNALLHDGDILDIVSRRALKEPLKSIAADYDVSKSLISQIALGKVWRHIQRDKLHPHETSSVRMFSDDEIREIRKRRAAGEYLVPLARTFGTDHSNIRNIYLRKTYKEVVDAEDQICNAA